MKYSNVINKTLNYFRDTSLWQFKQHSNELKDFRQDISGQWDDNAAKDINAQYITPYEEDGAAMRMWLDKKQQIIEQLSAGLDVLAANNDQIIALSNEIRKYFSDCEEDLRKVITNFDFAFNRKNDADEKIPDIISNLNAANKNEYHAVY